MDRTKYLSKEEVRHFTSKSDWLAGRTLLVSWSLLLAVFWMVDSWTNPLTIVLAVVLLAGRQLGLAVITHECGHTTFFKTRALNPLVGQLLAANPVFSDMPSYARGHANHHRLAGTPEDTDLSNYQAYPVSRESFKRKVTRDLTGQTGYKLLRYVLTSAVQVFSSDPQVRARAWPFAQQLLVNAVLALLLGTLFSPWAYLLWLVSYLTTHMLIVRIRQVAEHAAVPDLYDSDPRHNTRTTIPSWWERLCFAPNYVNYHLEHHFMASVPCYRLKQLHELLKQRGAYADTTIFHGYRDVLRHAIA
jgi:fatty acid desaturase